MSWDSIAEILTSHPADIKVEEGSHKVLLVEPQPDNRAASRTRIVTKTISQLLWERDSDEQWQNHHKLFKTLLRETSAKGFCGLLFEPAFHELCVHGTTFTLYPMARRMERVNDDTFTINWCRIFKSKSKSKTLKLRRQNRIFFDEKNPITSLLANHYYQPTTSNYPSFDSFVYDPGLCQISAFQVTIAETYGFMPKAVNALYELGRRLQIDGLKIRIIVVVFGDAQVVNKDLFDRLGPEAYTLKVTGNQLYPYS